jgi:hypothetical protein
VELRHAQRGRKHAQGESHRVVLVDDNEEQPVSKDRPHKDVGKDARHQAVLVRHHDGPIPIDGHKRPGQGARDGGQVDEAGVRVVAEVERRQVDKVDEEEDLGPDKVPVDKEQDPRGVEQVVGNKVTSDRAGGVDRLDLGREEVGDVSNLEDEDCEPRGVLAGPFSGRHSVDTHQ